ncbi:hypothetical protein [Clostridium kluyveri]|uniref:Uncharacterized protein n=1 Tax=Clostridium kluyveri (strain ATCC 8527 / DSM 555 / NBRC 12016 / NCIMB 10680 / K1) TaxID=431943 RepID=A5N1G7_CLOK5|nr:hypothetical protein [Clostridium kluyveri]EDK34963.1 Hypothetical protein CKL_2954 [Clostridium kluyveri DSM 555]
MNETYKKALNNQKIPFEHLNNLKAICENCENQFGEASSYIALAASCFNYGVMIGKSQERLKRKKGDRI